VCVCVCVCARARVRACVCVCKLLSICISDCFSSHQLSWISHVFTQLTLGVPDVLLPVLWALHDIYLLPSSPINSLESYGPLRCHRMVVLIRLVLTILFYPWCYVYSSQFSFHSRFPSHHLILQTPLKIFVTSFYFSVTSVPPFPTVPTYGTSTANGLIIQLRMLSLCPYNLHIFWADYSS
jgi:hypothetical protein